MLFQQDFQKERKIILIKNCIKRIQIVVFFNVYNVQPLPGINMAVLVSVSVRLIRKVTLQISGIKIVRGYQSNNNVKGVQNPHRFEF